MNIRRSIDAIVSSGEAEPTDIIVLNPKPHDAPQLEPSQRHNNRIPVRLDLLVALSKTAVRARLTR